MVSASETLRQRTGTHQQAHRRRDVREIFNIVDEGNGDDLKPLQSVASKDVLAAADKKLSTDLSANVVSFM